VKQQVEQQRHTATRVYTVATTPTKEDHLSKGKIRLLKLSARCVAWRRPRIMLTRCVWRRLWLIGLPLQSAGLRKLYSCNHYFSVPFYTSCAVLNGFATLKKQIVQIKCRFCVSISIIFSHKMQHKAFSGWKQVCGSKNSFKMPWSGKTDAHRTEFYGLNQVPQKQLSLMTSV